MTSILKAVAEAKVRRNAYIGLRLTPAEKNMMILKAKLYTGGNVTAWLVYCAMNHKPRIMDLIEETPTQYALRPTTRKK